MVLRAKMENALQAPPGQPGVVGWWKSFFCVHLGLVTWTMGLPFAIAGIAAVLRGWYGAATFVFVVIIAPYTVVTTRWPRWNRLCIDNFTSSRAFAKCTMLQDSQEPVDFGTGQKDKKGEANPVLLAYAPHGVFCTAFSGSHGVLHPTFWDNDVVFLLAGALYSMPLFRLFVVAMFGNIKDASKSTMESLMRQRRNIALLPGGFEEASIAEPGKDRVFVRGRKGFIKLALRHGYTIHPIYTFGEADTYHNFVPTWLPFKVRWFINSYKLPVVAPWGRWWAPLQPIAGAELHTVIGRPIKCPKIDELELQKGKLIDEYHRKYVAELLRAFDEHKGKFGRANAQLEIY